MKQRQKTIVVLVNFFLLFIAVFTAELYPSVIGPENGALVIVGGAMPV